VIVTATRLPVPQAAPTASATVITGAELRARGITHVLDALRDVPGAALVQNGSFGAATSLFLRGGENKYVQVLVDGVPVNDAGGSFNFANLTTDNVERIEVLRGPASVLYGSDAVTGVVQIFTNRGAPRTRGDLAARGGSFGTREYEGQGSGQARGIGWSAGAQRLGSDGILAFNNRYRNESGSGALRWARDGVGDAALAVRVQRAQYNFPTNGAGVPVDSNAFRREERATVSLDAGRFVRPGSSSAPSSASPGSGRATTIGGTARRHARLQPGLRERRRHHPPARRRARELVRRAAHGAHRRRRLP
jgi:vitamin B12 transporter